MVVIYSSYEILHRPHNVRAWKLLLLLPRILLHTAQRGGEAGERELHKRIELFDDGQWAELLRRSRQRQVSMGSSRNQTGQARIEKAIALVEEGELSHAARVLQASALAPGTEATLQELTNPRLRPQAPAEPIPQRALDFIPQTEGILDKQIFADVLRSTRRGLSPGLFGSRNEHFKICLEDNTSLDALYEVAQRLARAEVPNGIAEAMRMSSITALIKTSGFGAFLLQTRLDALSLKPLLGRTRMC